MHSLAPSSPASHTSHTPGGRLAAERPPLQHGRPAWPQMALVIGPTRLRSALERVKYNYRMLRARSHRPALLASLAESQAWGRMFAAEPRFFHPPISHFLDRCWSTQRRFEVCRADLRVAQAKFGPELAERLSRGETVRLVTQESFSLDLSLNAMNLQEGLWALSLRDGEGRRLFNLSFGFLADEVALIASVQGVPADHENLIAANQLLTKQAHGLRPPHLLVNAFQMLGARWGLREIQGIDPTHHIKGRWNQRAKRLRFDYRALWTELGAERTAGGHWQLPASPRRRADADIPTRKRGLYRKRYELLDLLNARIAAWGG